MPAEKETKRNEWFQSWLKKIFSIRGLVIFSFFMAFIIAALVIIEYIGMFGKGLSSDHSRWAEFGDFIGGSLNPVFAFFGLFALLLTILLQSKELGLTRKEMEMTRAELTSQNETLVQQKFENTFFQMLKLHNYIVDSISLQTGRATNPIRHVGRACFVEMLNNLKIECRNLGPNAQSMEAINDKYSELFNKYRHSLAHYFRNLYYIYKFIDNGKISIGDKNFYGSLIKSQLSIYEVMLVFYNCFSDKGRGKFLPLAQNYSLFESMPEDLYIDPSHNEWLLTTDAVVPEPEAEETSV
ncbi:putative phage abortive infection protein [Microbulbifer sp. TYP-18]|uniref:putative phage abortive infection protein n=1 Tax=Microbulbifer sp. TYP-18 TaxID=3230024 RepID=UPI0034C6DA3E